MIPCTLKTRRVNDDRQWFLQFDDGSEVIIPNGRFQWLSKVCNIGNVHQIHECLPSFKGDGDKTPCLVKKWHGGIHATLLRSHCILCGKEADEFIERCNATRSTLDSIRECPSDYAYPPYSTHVPCFVTNYGGGLMLESLSGHTSLVQTESDVEAFLNDCGQSFETEDIRSIRYCPAYWLLGGCG